MNEINSLTLNNGLTIINEEIPHIQSITMAIWFKYGSRHENVKQHGLTHFLEHMFFKGTKKRSPLDIAESLEIVGGELNAFTARENCCYYAKAINEHDDLIFDVLSDLILHSTFDELEMQRERQVIFQEIDTYEDSAEELVHDILVEKMYGKGLGHPIIGNKKSLNSFTRADLINYYQKICQPEQVFITIVGNISKQRIAKLANQYFANWTANTAKQSIKTRPETKKQAFFHKQKEVEQTHLNIGFHTFSITHKDRYILHLISSYLGGGMSAALFQRIREQLGLVYSIYTYVRAFTDTGSIGIYSAHQASSTSQILMEIYNILADLMANGILAKKLLKLKNQLKGSLLLDLERSSFRMQRIAVGYLYFKHVFSAEELIELVNQVNNDDIKRVANKIFKQTPTIIQVGPENESLFLEKIKGSRFY